MTMPSASRRGLFAALVSAGATSLLPATLRAAADPSDFRPFRLDVSDEALVDLRAHLRATRRPGGAPVADQAQPMQLAMVRKLARFWLTDLDWRKVEARMNTLPQFTTSIDGLKVHFIHVRSKHRNAMPLLVSYGWPSSIVERAMVVDPRTNTTGHGGSARDAFDVVIPSLPAYGFSRHPIDGGWDPVRIARAEIALMKRLGYTRFVVQGGDWTNAEMEQVALPALAGSVDIHTNMPPIVSGGVSKALRDGGPPPGGLAAGERHTREQFTFLYERRLSYVEVMKDRPQTLFEVGNSPVGLGPWTIEHDAASYALIASLTDNPRILRATASSQTSRSTG